MSGGRNKLGDFSQLKSLVGSGLKGLKEKTQRFRKLNTEQQKPHEETREVRINAEYGSDINKTDKTGKTAGASAERHPRKNQKFSKSNSNTGHAHPNHRAHVKGASDSKNTQFRMPQYGQKLQQSILPVSTKIKEEAEDVLVIHVDLEQQARMSDSRLFAWLCQRFPKCFNPKDKKPLKIGISEDIERLYKQECNFDIDPYALRQVLRRYVGDQHYQRSLIKYKARYDLKGEVAENLSEEHLEHAEVRLSELREKAEFRAQGGTNAEFYEMKRQLEEAKTETQANNIQVSDDHTDKD